MSRLDRHLVRGAIGSLIVAASLANHQPAVGAPLSDTSALPAASTRFGPSIHRAIDLEVAGVMEATPPERRVTIDLATGGSIDISPSRILVGRNGADCRDFDYLYTAPNGGTAMVIGQRCWDPAEGWIADRADMLVSEQDLPPPDDTARDPGAAAAGRDLFPGGFGPASSPPGALAEAGAGARSLAGEPGGSLAGPDRGVARAETSASSVTPPSRIILPFPLDGQR